MKRVGIIKARDRSSWYCNMIGEMIDVDPCHVYSDRFRIPNTDWNRALLTKYNIKLSSIHTLLLTIWCTTNDLDNEALSDRLRSLDELEE